MSVATAAEDFSAPHSILVIFFRRHAALSDRLIKAGPTAAGFVLGLRAEQLLAATDAGVGSLLLLRVVPSCEWRFGSALSCHTELLVGQLRSPLGFTLVNLFGHKSLNQIRCATAEFDSVWRSHGALERVPDAQDRALFEVSSEDLHSDRQPFCRLSTWHGNAGNSCKRRGDRENIGQIHRERVVGFLAELECRSRSRWC